jgi:hypothetical protein
MKKILITTAIIIYIIAACSKSNIEYTPAPIVSLVPTINSFTPKTGKTGEIITIDGTNFTTLNANIVTINGKVAAVKSTLQTKIEVLVPADCGDGSIVVENINGKATSKDLFKYIVPEPTAPTITNFTPTVAKAGGTITITGTNFSIATPNIVTLNGNNAIVQSATNTSIVITIPTGTGTGSLVVTNINGSATAGSTFSYALLPPIITTFSPTSAKIGDVVTITGENFTTTTPNVVTINGNSAVVQSVTATTITILVPNGSGSGVVKVTNINGEATASVNFNYALLPPTISGFSPMAGKAGDLININGTNFTTATPNTVKINGNTAVVQSVTSTSITVAVPNNASSGLISVSNSNGSATSADNFTFVDNTNSVALPKSAYFVRYSNENVTGKFDYNGNKLSSITFTESLTSRKNSKTTYSYFGDLITKIYYTTDDSFDYLDETFEYNGNLLSKSILTISQGGKITKITKTYSHNGNTVNFTKTTQVDNETPSSTDSKLVFSNGNIIENEGVTFTYDNANNFAKNITGHDKILAEGLFIRCSKNNVIKEVGSNYSVQNSYDYNSNNYPLNVTTTRSFTPGGDALVSIGYTY